MFPAGDCETNRLGCCCCELAVEVYIMHMIYMYLQAFVDMVTNKSTAVLRLPLHAEALKGLIKSLDKRPFFELEAPSKFSPDFVNL